jgi:hypothetical protein
MSLIVEKIAKLIDIKSIVTIAVTIVFCVLSMKQVINGEQFLTIFSVIIAFYFGTQYQKNAQAKQQEPALETTDEVKESKKK